MGACLYESGVGWVGGQPVVCARLCWCSQLCTGSKQWICPSWFYLHCLPSTINLLHDAVLHVRAGQPVVLVVGGAVCWGLVPQGFKGWCLCCRVEATLTNQQ